MDQRAWQATQSMVLQRVRLKGESNTKMSLEGFRTLNLLQSRDNFWSGARCARVCVCDGLKILPEIDIYLKSKLLG